MTETTLGNKSLSQNSTRAFGPRFDHRLNTGDPNPDSSGSESPGALLQQLSVTDRLRISATTTETLLSGNGQSEQFTTSAAVGLNAAQDILARTPMGAVFTAVSGSADMAEAGFLDSRLAVGNSADSVRTAQQPASSQSDKQLQQITQSFQDNLATTAAEADSFHSLMHSVFGKQYDRAAAETIRQQTLSGDFSWMPDIRVTGSTSLVDTSGTQGSRTGLGAYDSGADTIYLSEQLLQGDAYQALSILTEEIGHALDSRLNSVDSAGDEGELFARMVAGESLSDSDIAEIRAENDHGTILVDGKAIDVEYGWFSDAVSSVGNAISSGVSSIGNAISSGARAVGSAISDGARAVGSAISDGARAVGSAISDGARAVGSAISDGVKAVGGAISSGIRSVGNFLSDGVNFLSDLATDGLDFVNKRVVSPVLNRLPVVGPWLNDHIVQPAFGLADTAVHVTANVFDSAIDLGTNALAGGVDIATNLLSGDFGGAWQSTVDTARTLGQDVVGFVIESVVLPVKGIAGAINDAFNLAETRSLRTEERAYLETIYGNSLDYDEIRIQQGGGVESWIPGLRPHAVGNDIYMSDWSFNPDGSLTPAGLDLLAHEAGHVWQFQTDGASYIGDAVISYVVDEAGAYDFTTAIEQQIPWGEMTPDQQAEIAMVIGEAIEQDASGSLSAVELRRAIDSHNGSSRGMANLTNQQFVYLQNIHQILLNS